MRTRDIRVPFSCPRSAFWEPHISLLFFCRHLWIACDEDTCQLEIPLSSTVPVQFWSMLFHFNPTDHGGLNSHNPQFNCSLRYHANRFSMQIIWRSESEFLFHQPPVKQLLCMQTRVNQLFHKQKRRSHLIQLEVKQASAGLGDNPFFIFFLMIMEGIVVYACSDSNSNRPFKEFVSQV